VSQFRWYTSLIKPASSNLAISLFITSFLCWVKLPCKDVPIFLEEFDELEFLFRVQTDPHMSIFRWFIQGQWNCLGEVVLWMDGCLGCLGLRHDRVRVGLGQGCLQLLEFYGRQKLVCRLSALPITIVSAFYIPFDGDDSFWAFHLQNQVGILRNHHELGQCRPPEECIVCHLKIGYLKLHVLGAEVLLSPEGHGKSDLAGGGATAPGTIP
jgi:hypothetical protein